MTARNLSYLWVTLGVSLFGCAGQHHDLAYVTGTVRLDGSPLANARLEFASSDGAVSYGLTDESGNYELRILRDTPGISPGTYRVRISTYRPAEGESPGALEQVPVRYNEESELVRDIALGSTVIDFELESKGIIRQPNQDRPPMKTKIK